MEEKRLNESVDKIFEMLREIQENTKYMKEFMQKHDIPMREQMPQAEKVVSARQTAEEGWIVENQEELDSFPKTQEGTVRIWFGTPDTPAFINNDYACRFVIHNNYCANVFGNNFLVAYDDSTVKVHDNCFAKAYNNANVLAYGQCHLEAYEQSTVELHDFSEAQGFGESYFDTYDNSNVFLNENSNAASHDKSTVEDYRPSRQKDIAPAAENERIKGGDDQFDEIPGTEGINELFESARTILGISK